MKAGKLRWRLVGRVIAAVALCALGVAAFAQSEPANAHVAPDLETTVDFLNRMVAPEQRQVLLGDLEGLKPAVGETIVIISDQPVLEMIPDGASNKDGYPELTYRIGSEVAKKEQAGQPYYMRFSLQTIDPSSIQSQAAAYDVDAGSAFASKHAKCGDSECRVEYEDFLESVPRVTEVVFHASDLQPTIEIGHFQSRRTCPDSDRRIFADCGWDPIPDANTAKAGILFRDADRAERFVTALRSAVESQAGEPDLFPPTPESGEK